MDGSVAERPRAVGPSPGEESPGGAPPALSAGARTAERPGPGSSPDAPAAAVAAEIVVKRTSPRGQDAPTRQGTLRPPMEKFVIEGGVPLSGTIVPAGNKNGALPILAACLLTDDEVILRNVPRIRDVEAMTLLLEQLGATVQWLGPGEISIDSSSVDSWEVDEELAERIRASFLLAGPLLAPVRAGPDAPAGRRRHRPPAPGPAPGRVPRPRRLRRGAPRAHQARGAARPETVRLPDGRAVGDGHRERVDGGGADPRADRDPQRCLRAARPGPGPPAGRDGRPDRRDRLERHDRPRRRESPGLHPLGSPPTTSRSDRSSPWPE